MGLGSRVRHLLILMRVALANNYRWRDHIDVRLVAFGIDVNMEVFYFVPCDTSAAIQPLPIATLTSEWKKLLLKVFRRPACHR